MFCIAFGTHFISVLLIVLDFPRAVVRTLRSFWSRSRLLLCCSLSTCLLDQINDDDNDDDDDDDELPKP